MISERPEYKFKSSIESVIGTKQSGIICFTSDVDDSETVTFLQENNVEYQATVYELKYNLHYTTKIIAVSSGLSASDVIIKS